MTRRTLINFGIVIFCALILGLKWIVEPGPATRLADIHPLAEEIHQALRPLVFRPYIF